MSQTAPPRTRNPKPNTKIVIRNLPTHILQAMHESESNKMEYAIMGYIGLIGYILGLYGDSG